METRLSIRLKELRKSQQLSPTQVVKKLQEINLNYSSQSIYKWEEGESIPPANTLYELAKIYNCNICYLVDDEDGSFAKISPYDANILRLFRTDFLFRSILSLIAKLIERNTR